MNKSSIAIVALLALIGGFSISWFINNSKPVELEDGLWFGEQARALPEFELLNHNNEPMTRSSLNGKWSLIFFGYTHCPDICPASLQTMAEMFAAIEDPDVVEVIQVYFVSVDPERDNAEILANYVTYFNPAFIGATAPLEKLTPLTRSLGIAHDIRNKTESSTNYDVDHSSAIVLINPRAEFAGLFGAPHDALALARDMTRIVEHN
jgi:protein SCO1/2